MRHLFAALVLVPFCDPGFAQERPNILLLVAEDLSPRIGSYGDSIAQTPNLDALARAGVQYTRVFTAAGVCAPSRAALITGLHQISFGAQHMRSWNAGYFAVPPEGAKAFPELLRAAGYYTFTDSKLDYQFSELAAGTGPFTIWDAEGAGSDWTQRDQGRPFFGLVNFQDTHESRIRREWREAGNPIAEEVTDPAKIRLPPYYPDIPEVRRDLARHYDDIHQMDQRVGEILRRLEEGGLADSTIVIWTTDHGDALPRAKRELYDSGIRVPMLVRFPASLAPEGWQPGSIQSKLVSFVDLAPTILALAGVTAPGYLHGVNFLTDERSYIHASRDRIDQVPDRQRAVRDPRFKYIRSWYPDLPGGHALAYRDTIDMVAAMRALHERGLLDETQSRWFEPAGKEQLYDVMTDPYEVRNLADDPTYTAEKQRMSAELDRFLTAVGDWSEEDEGLMRRRLLSPAGEIRTTRDPAIAIGADGVLISADNNASIGYRVNGGPWRLYTRGMQGLKGTIEAKAIRYGWRESATVALELE